MADTSKSKVSSTTLMFEEEVVERRLAFKPDPELGNLCMGIINDVRIDIREVPLLDDKGVESTWEYAGCKFPVLIIEFKQCKTDANPKDRYYTFTAKPVTTLNKKGEPVEEKTVINIIQQVYGQLRHIANQFKGLKGYPVNAGKCPGLDYAAPAKVRCEQYLAFFEYFKHLLVGDDEKNPIYKNVKLFMKLVADYNTHKFLAFLRLLIVDLLNVLFPVKVRRLNLKLVKQFILQRMILRRIVKLPQVFLLPLPVLLLFRRIFRTFLIGTRSSIYHITKQELVKEVMEVKLYYLLLFG